MSKSGTYVSAITGALTWSSRKLGVPSGEFRAARANAMNGTLRVVLRRRPRPLPLNFLHDLIGPLHAVSDSRYGGRAKLVLVLGELSGGQNASGD